jgi:fucose 4-O-acetylase-like acetyltransferase
VWADLIRVVALTAVILLHIAAVPVTHFKDLPIEKWWWANAYDSLARPCIPLFVMLSGALLLTGREWNPGTFVRKRVRKVVIPFVAWSAIYFAWNGVVNDGAVSVARFMRHWPAEWPIRSTPISGTSSSSSASISCSRWSASTRPTHRSGTRAISSRFGSV